MRRTCISSTSWMHTTSRPARGSKRQGFTACKGGLILNVSSWHRSLSLCRHTRGVSEDARTFCSWLKGDQFKKCSSQPVLGLAARNGVELALKECRSRFTDRRWNCSGVTIADVFQNERMLKAGMFVIFQFAHTLSKLYSLHFIQHTTKGIPPSALPFYDLVWY